MNTRSFTIIETVLAAILAMLLMAGSVGVIQNMQRETARFKTQVDNDTIWMSANIHLARMVRASSYLELSNQVGTTGRYNTLTLYDYNNNVRGIYTNDPANNRIDYTVGGVRQARFQNVNATFSLPSPASPGKGWKDGRLIETIIDYIAPFANTLRLRCAVGVASAASSTWAITIGRGYTELGYSVQQTTDSSGKPTGYIVAGRAYSYHPAHLSQVYLANISLKGVFQWSKVFSGNGNAAACSVQQTTDKGYTVIGNTSWASGSAVYLVKTNSIGVMQWQNFIFGSSGYGIDARSAQQTTDRGYIVTGSRASIGGTTGDDIFLAKTNSIGATQWSRTFVVSSGYDYGNSVQQTTDGGYIIAGQGGPFICCCFIKTDSVGGAQWSKTFNNGDVIGSVQQTADGGYIAICRSFTLLKFDSSGAQQWSRRLVSSGFAASVRQTADGGYIVAGLRRISAGVYDVYLIKTNSSGVVETGWPKTFGGSGDDGAWAAQQTTDSSGKPTGYIVAGYTSSYGGGGYDIYLIKTDVNGNCPEASKPIHYDGYPT